MSAAATSVGATATPVSYPQPSTGPQLDGVSLGLSRRARGQASVGRGENFAVGG